MVDNENYEKLLEHTEFHNWLFKFIQCLSNVFEFFSKTLIYKNLFANFASKITSARKIFRLLKFLNEIPRMYYLVDCKFDGFSKNLNFLSRLFSCIFYLFENITLFQHLKLINDNTLIHFEIIMSLSFMLSQTFQSIYYFFILKKTYLDEEQLKKKYSSQVKLKDIYNHLGKLSKIRFNVIKALVKCFGDLSLALYDLKLMESILSGKLSKLVLSVTGLLSTIVAITQLSSKED